MKRICNQPWISLLTLLSGTLVLGVAQAQAGLVRASDPSPFASCAIGPWTYTDFGEINYLNAEVEPYVAVNRRHPEHIVGVWQQDRYTYGGARGLVTGVSHDGGSSWTTTFPHFSVCAGGNRSNGGDYERASDPWVTVAADGVVYQISLSFDFIRDANEAVLVSRSTDHGDTWSEPTALLVDTDPNVGDDKESITADPKHARFVYAVWDRLDYRNGFTGPIWFARTTNGGKSWEPARLIYDPGANISTIGSQIVVLPNGTLVDIFEQFDFNVGGATVAVIRSKDRGRHWSAPVVINTVGSIGVIDQKTGEYIRASDGMPAIAVDPKTGTLYAVWQDARFSGYLRDGIALAKSVDGGLTWSEPVQLNRMPDVQAFTAAIDVADDGTVAVAYYDFRKDNADPAVLLTDYWQITSHDRGATWNERHRGGSFDMRTAPYARGYFVGDYQSLAHQDDTFLPFFVKTRTGNHRNRTDVFAAISDEPEDRGNGHVEVNTRPRSLRERMESHREGRPH